MTDIIGAKAVTINPALKPFEFLLGEWETFGRHPYFPDINLHGRASFTRIEGGAFLMLRSEINHPKFPDGIQIFGSDDQAGTYYMLHFDERGTSRKYDVSILKNQLMWWRHDDHFSQRFTMDIQETKIESYGEMSRDGGKWEQDLSLTYRKL